MTTDKTHKPSEAEYGDYDYICSFYQGSCGEEFADYLAELFSQDEYSLEQAQAKWPSYQGNFSKKNSCDHCGARFKWGAVYLHTLSNELVHVGHTCASNSFNYPSRAAKLKAVAQKMLAELNKLAKAKAELFAKYPGLQEAFQIDHYIINDIRGRFERWLSISEKQVALVLKISAESKAPKAEPVGEPCPTVKREMVSGTIVSIKVKNTAYGEQVKMLVQDARGFRVWGSMPAKFVDDPTVVKGSEIEFCADLERSNKDDHFGFFGRPTKAQLLKAASQAA